MRVALGVLNKEIERLQAEIDAMPTIQSNPARYARLTAEIEELLLAWQVLKDWKEPKIDFSKFFERSYQGDWKEGIVEKEAKYDHCRCVSTDPSDVTLCDRCPDNKESYGPAQEINIKYPRPFNQEKADMIQRVFSVRNEGDRFDPNQKPLHDPTTYTQRDSGIPLVDFSSSIEP